MVSYKSYITLLKILIVGMRSRCQSSHADNYPPPKTPSNGRLLTELDHGVTKEGWPGSCTTNHIPTISFSYLLSLDLTLTVKLSSHKMAVISLIS